MAVLVGAAVKIYVWVNCYRGGALVATGSDLTRLLAQDFRFLTHALLRPGFELGWRAV